MPRLNTLIEVGFCSSYGDRDYRVSTAVADMEQRAYDELRLAVLGALRCADEMRIRHRKDNKLGEFAPAAASTKATPPPNER